MYNWNRLFLVKMILQLNPPIPMSTPKGDGWAFFMIERSQEHHIEWVVFLDNSGQCWTFQNPEVRMQNNYTMNRKKDLSFNNDMR
jgi:hypothetical protein